jgi:anti-anti-sigma factor
MQSGDTPFGDEAGLPAEFVMVSGRPCVRGELDLLNLPALEAWLAGLGGQFRHVDLSGVTFFDSCALRAFLNVRRRIPDFRIVCPSESVLRVLEITGTVDYLVHGRDINW